MQSKIRLFMTTALLFVLAGITTASAQTSASPFSAAASRKPLSEDLSFQASIRSDSASFILTIDNPQSRILSVQIRQSGTGMLLDTLIAARHHACRYHFTDVTDGEFEVMVRYGKSKWMRKVSLTTYQKEERMVKVN